MSSSEHLATRFAAFVDRNDRNAERRAARAAEATDPTPTSDGAYQMPLARLYERFDAAATGRESAFGVDRHAAVVERLTTNRAYAEAAGWTACALERDGGMGRLRMIGVAPGGAGRSIVPDWNAGVAADASDAEGTPER